MDYKKCRQSAKRVISSANEKEQKECASDLNDPEHQNEIFRMANQMVKERPEWKNGRARGCFVVE